MYNLTPCLITRTHTHTCIYIYMYVYLLFQSFVTVTSPFYLVVWRNGSPWIALGLDLHKRYLSTCQLYAITVYLRTPTRVNCMQSRSTFAPPHVPQLQYLQSGPSLARTRLLLLVHCPTSRNVGPRHRLRGSCLQPQAMWLSIVMGNV